jgi:DNA-binding MarR family transcriptional regulator
LSNSFPESFLLRIMAPVIRDHDDHTGRILAEWAREVPDLDTASIAVIGRILRSARLLEREIERELARFGLGVPEFNALSALRRVGPPYSLTPTELGRALLFTSGGLTKLLERLERAGFVRRETSATDRRVVHVCLEPAGREVQEQAMRAHIVNEDELLSPLGQRDRERLADVLGRLLVALEGGDGRMRPLIRPGTTAGQEAGA